MVELRLARHGPRQRGGVEQRLLAIGGRQGLEAVAALVQQVQAGVDAVLLLEVVEEGLAETHAELHRPQVLAAVLHGHDAARAQAGDAALEPAHRLLRLVGGHHGEAEGREIVAKLLRHVHAQPGGGRRRVELELLHPVVLGQGLEGRNEQLRQGLAVAAVELLLLQRHRRDQGAQRFGGAVFRGNGVVDGLEMRVQCTALGGVHQAGHVRQIGEGQDRAHATDGDAHHHHDLGPETEFVKHVQNLKGQRAERQGAPPPAGLPPRAHARAAKAPQSTFSCRAQACRKSRSPRSRVACAPAPARRAAPAAPGRYHV